MTGSHERAGASSDSMYSHAGTTARSTHGWLAEPRSDVDRAAAVWTTTRPRPPMPKPELPQRLTTICTGLGRTMPTIPTQGRRSTTGPAPGTHFASRDVPVTGGD